MKVKEKFLQIDLELLAEAVDNSLSLAQTLSYIGLSIHPRSFSVFKQFLDDCDIDYSHFTINGRPKANYIEKICPNCNKTFKVIDSGKHKLQKTCSTACYNSYYRSGVNSPNYKHGESTYRAKAIKAFGHECILCGETSVVEVHHIDEDRTNNSLSNLVVLCPTCHVLIHKHS